MGEIFLNISWVFLTTPTIIHLVCLQKWQWKTWIHPSHTTKVVELFLFVFNSYVTRTPVHCSRLTMKVILYRPHALHRGKERHHFHSFQSKKLLGGLRFQLSIDSMYHLTNVFKLIWLVFLHSVLPLQNALTLIHSLSPKLRKGNCVPTILFWEFHTPEDPGGNDAINFLDILTKTFLSKHEINF